jgi:glycosyltransferase involved in cell wall biosynthesis
MRLAIVQFGAFAEAARRFAAGGKETYYAQKYAVDFVSGLAARVEELTVIHLGRDDAEERLPSGVRSIGLQLYRPGQRARRLELLRLLRRLRPDHLVLSSPLPFVLSWARVSGVRVLPLFADSFNDPSFKVRATSAALASLLNSKSIEWVSNHNLAASLDLVRIGVSPGKVLPHDWPALITPDERPAKELPTSAVLRAFYVGQLTEPKGLGDLIDAVATLDGKNGGRPWHLTIAGGTSDEFARRAAALGASERVHFEGRIPHDRVVPLMNEHDAVVVPSRHEYPEGLPMTIYEGLCSRTPLVVSDHPMFRFKVFDGDNVLMYPASQSAKLADCLSRLDREPDLYRRLSIQGGASASDFFCPLKYHDLVTRWLSGTAEDRQVLSTYSLASGRYDAVLAKRDIIVPASVPFAPVRSFVRSLRG